jgi:hypothetical protein
MAASKRSKRSVSIGTVVFRCGTAEARLTLTVRDVHLLDGEYFLTWPRSQAAPEVEVLHE